MSEYLVTKEWGYQTCCPDEENTVGYFTPKNNDEIQFYDGPSYDSNILDKVKDRKFEQWKYDTADKLNLNLREMDDKFGIKYEVENLDFLIYKSNGIWGWEKVIDKENKITWIRISEDNDVWAPYDDYDSDSESDTNPQDD
jgi:hypothetical protein